MELAVVHGRAVRRGRGAVLPRRTAPCSATAEPSLACRSAASAPTTFCSHARSESSAASRRSRRIAQLHSSWRRRPPPAGRRSRSARPRARRAQPGTSRRMRSWAMTSAPATARGRAASPSSGTWPSGATVKGAGAPAMQARRPRRRPDRPVAPALDDRCTSRESSERSSTCRRSPARRMVEPRGGIASPPRTMTLTTASRGSPRSRTRAPPPRRPRRRGTRDLGAQAPDRARLGERARQRGLVRGGAEPAGQRLEADPLDDRREEHREEDDVERAACSRSPRR